MFPAGEFKIVFRCRCLVFGDDLNTPYSLETGSSSHRSFMESLYERNTAIDGVKKEVDG